MIAVCCDSGSQLPAALAAAHGIEVVPLSVTIDGVDPLEGVDLDADGFWAHFGPGRIPQVATAAPSPGHIAATYQRLVERGATAIVSIHTGSGLSGRFNAARLAAEEASVPVQLVDIRQRRLSWGVAALAAAEELAAGRSANSAIGEARSSDEAAEVMAAEILTAGDRLRIGIGVDRPRMGPVGADAPNPDGVRGSTRIRSIHATGNEHTRIGNKERHQVRDS